VELEHSASDSSLDRPSRNEEVIGLLAERASVVDRPPIADRSPLADRAPADRTPAEREGLPRSYRMRADPHYVEQLDSSCAGPVIRLIATRQIDAGDPPAPARLEALSQSIATHGIVQPLLVRRHNGRYQLIAGRKRLAAAVAAGVAEVPCVMYEVDEQEAAALAQADNLRFTQPQEQSQPPIDAERFQQLLKALSADLASITSSTAILRSAPTGTFLQHRVAADLIQAQAWRAAWSVGATGLVTGQHRAGRTRPIGAILDGVKAGFESESRLSGLQVETIVSANAASIVFDDDACGAAVIGAVLTTLSWLEGIEEPRIEIRADVPRARTLRIEVVQRMTTVPAEAARYFLEAGSIRSANLTIALGVLAVKTLTAQHGGAAEFAAIKGRGSIIRSTFMLPS